MSLSRMHSLAESPSPERAARAVGRATPTPEVCDRLVDALAEVIDAHGYGPSRVRDVAGRARVSLTTFYLAFPTKQHCLVALAARVGDDAANWIARRALGADLAPSEIEGAIRDGLLVVLARPRLAYALLVELASLGDDERRVWRDGLAGVTDAVCDGIHAAAGVAAGSRLSPAAAAFVVGGLIEGLIALIVDREGAVGAADERVDLLAATAARAIAGLMDETPAFRPSPG